MNNKPHICGRYVDDIFVSVKNQEELQQLKHRLTEASVLNFTHEEAVQNSLPFLDVLTTATNAGFTTTVYTKPSNIGSCLNGKSECPQRYRTSTMNAYIRRALTHCSTWNNTHQELERVTQVLINNGYENTEVNTAIRNAIDKWYKKEDPEKTSKILLYYKNIMSTEYKTDERIIKDIVQHHVKPTNEEDCISLIIYYNTKKTSQLLIKNNTTKKKTPLQEDHVIYKHACKIEDCGPQTYIGMTRTTLSRRLTCHLQNGTIKNHYNTSHKTTTTRKHLEENTTIIDRERDPRRLLFLESLYIAQDRPAMSLQTQDLQILPTQKRKPTRPDTNTTSTRRQAAH